MRALTFALVLVAVMATVSWAGDKTLEQLPTGGWVEIPLIIMGIYTAGKQVVKGVKSLLHALGITRE